MSDDKVVRGHTDSRGSMWWDNGQSRMPVNTPVVVCPAEHYDALKTVSEQTDDVVSKAFDAGVASVSRRMISREEVRLAIGRAIDYSMVVDGDHHTVCIYLYGDYAWVCVDEGEEWSVRVTAPTAPEAVAIAAMTALGHIEEG